MYFIDHPIVVECPGCGSRYWTLHPNTDEICPVKGCGRWFIGAEHRPVRRRATDRQKLTEEEREKLRVVRDLLREALFKLGLEECSFSWDYEHPNNWMGRCTWFYDGHRHIELNAPQMLRSSLSECLDTVLHECSHALCEHDAGHGDEWCRVAQRLGVKDLSQHMG